MGSGSSTTFTKDDDGCIRAPELKPTGAGGLVGQAVGSVAGHVAAERMKVQNPVVMETVRTGGGELGRTVGNAAESAVLSAVFAQERIDAQVFNEAIKSGESQAGALEWMRMMRPTE